MKEAAWRLILREIRQIVKAELQASTGEIRGEIKALKGEMQGELKALHTEIQSVKDSLNVVQRLAVLEAKVSEYEKTR